MEESTSSDCRYCYKLECSVQVLPTSKTKNKATVTSKRAYVTVGRNDLRNIIVQIELLGNNRRGHPTVANYLLHDAVLHQSNISKGIGCIEIPSRNLIIQLSNCAPRKLNVFLKSLQAKIDLLKNDKCGEDKSKISELLSKGLPSINNVLSPLSIVEIRRFRRMKGMKSPATSQKKQITTPQRNSTDTPKILKPNNKITPITAAREKRLMAGSLNLVRSNLFADFEGKNNVPENTISFEPLPAIKEEADISEKPVLLTAEQEYAVKTVLSNKNVFFTGSAGTGKSVVLRKIIEMLPASSTFITAATGVAACQIGGTTLHSFAGIGTGEATVDQCYNRIIDNKVIWRQWKDCTYLIIDEISMIDKNFFTKLEQIGRLLKNPEKPFGGIQLIITGDFFQLPPVSKDENVEFCFESPAWRKCELKTIVLKNVQRQKDVEFVNILNRIRIGKCDMKMEEKLIATKNRRFCDGIVPTRLCSHTKDAQNINQHRLDGIKEPEKVFIASDVGFIDKNMQLAVEKRLVLKKGCQVMLMKNLDLSKGLSNGARGYVADFSENGNPIVHFICIKRIIEIRRCTFTLKCSSGDSLVTRTQIPLQLAWAISIHKSQGLTLDCVEMNLSRVFADGQTYVALSRARSMDSIKVDGFSSGCVRANQKVLNYYSMIEETGYEDGEE